MQTNNRDIASVWDMIRAICYIRAFTENISFEAYLDDIRTVSAVERQFEILGEAASRISKEFRQIHSEIDWKRIVGLRNIVSHRYDEVKQEILWAIIDSELDSLLNKLDSLLPPPPNPVK
ncbi:MAG: DUF86 domain-containing protein [Leptolyngbya sp. SIO4C5]|nr:DUF86 domain-containing protein [Leptolyngbya sp. SIO4C5]